MREKGVFFALTHLYFTGLRWKISAVTLPFCIEKTEYFI